MTKNHRSLAAFAALAAALLAACDRTDRGAPAAPAASAGAVAAAKKTEGLGVGDPAPEFSLPGSDGKTYRLADFRGKQAVVVAWFPKAFTGG